jgi:tetratricopeptide (TPR) repeat protein
MTAGRFLLLAAAAFAVPAAAAAAVTVIGNSSARLCYEAAESRMSPSSSSVSRCNDALSNEALSRYDAVATHVNRGILRLRMGSVDEAIADFDEAIALDPDQAEAYVNKGMATLRLPQGWEQAVPLFDAAIARRTRRPAIAYYGRGVAHEMAGNLKGAYRDYRQASLLEPKWRDPQVELSRFTVRQP